MEERLATFQSLLASRGLRATSQRLAIYEYLISTDSHPTAEEVYQALRRRFPTMSPATVYKTLQLLVRMSLVHELEFSEAPNRYDGNPLLHLNLICVRCRRIADLDTRLLARLRSRVQKESGYQLLGQRHEIYGVCPACARSS